jgi:hypothetical protein
MMNVYRVRSTAVEVPAGLRHISWGAILAGIAVTMVIYIGLNLLGLAVGASVIDMMEDPLSFEFATGTVVWIAASGLISLFAGGWVAGRMSRSYSEVDGVVHGIVVWAVASLVMFFLMFWSLNNVVNGAANAVGSGLSLAGTTLAEAAPEVAQATDLRDTTLTAIREDVGVSVENGVDSSAIYAAFTRLIRQDADSAEENRQEVITLLTTAGVPQEDAVNTVNRWETTYRGVQADLDEISETVADDVSDAVAASAGVGFMLMVIGAFAAGVGGMVGSSDVVHRDERIVTRTPITDLR